MTEGKVRGRLEASAPFRSVLLEKAFIIRLQVPVQGRFRACT